MASAESAWTTSSPCTTSPAKPWWETVTYRRSSSGTGQPSRHDEAMRAARSAVITLTVDVNVGGGGGGGGGAGTGGADFGAAGGPTTTVVVDGRAASSVARDPGAQPA